MGDPERVALHSRRVANRGERKATLKGSPCIRTKSLSTLRLYNEQP
jgi:hypothetical protein